MQIGYAEETVLRTKRLRARVRELPLWYRTVLYGRYWPSTGLQEQRWSEHQWSLSFCGVFSADIISISTKTLNTSSELCFAAPLPPTRGICATWRDLNQFDSNCPSRFLVSQCLRVHRSRYTEHANKPAGDWSWDLHHRQISGDERLRVISPLTDYSHTGSLFILVKISRKL